MGNEYKEKILRTIDPTWLWNQSKVYKSLPRNLKKNEIYNYNAADNNVLKPQQNRSYTLPKKLLKKLPSKVLVLQEGDKEKGLSLPENSKANGRNLATWNGESLKKDEVNKLKSYISDNNITTLCIVFVRPIDYTKGLKPLFNDVVSQSPTIDKLCININTTAKCTLTTKYFKNLLSCSVESLHKSGGQHLKNIYIGSDTIKPIDRVNFENILDNIYKVKLTSEAHVLKAFVVVGNYFSEKYHEYEKKYSKKIQFEIKYDPSNINATPKKIIECSQTHCSSKPNMVTKCFNTIIRNIISNKSDSEEEDNNTSISTHDNQDSLQDNVALGDAQPTADDMYL